MVEYVDIKYLSEFLSAKNFLSVIVDNLPDLQVILSIRVSVSYSMKLQTNKTMQYQPLISNQKKIKKKKNLIYYTAGMSGILGEFHYLYF